MDLDHITKMAKRPLLPQDVSISNNKRAKQELWDCNTMTDSCANLALDMERMAKSMRTMEQSMQSMREQNAAMARNVALLEPANDGGTGLSAHRREVVLAIALNHLLTKKSQWTTEIKNEFDKDIMPILGLDELEPNPAAHECTLEELRLVLSLGIFLGKVRATTIIMIWHAIKDKLFEEGTIRV